MARQVIDRGKTFVTLRIPPAELESLLAEIERRLKDHEYLVFVADDQGRKIVAVTLVSTTPGGQQAFATLAGSFTDASDVQAVADHPAVSNVELDF